MVSNDNIRVSFTDNSTQTRNELRQRLSLYSNESIFDDDVWRCNKAVKNKGESPSNYSISFRGIPIQYLEIFKYYILIRMGDVSIRNLHSAVPYYNHFFNFLYKDCNRIELSRVTSKTIKIFESYIANLELAHATKEAIWSSNRLFFKTMISWDETPNYNPFGSKNPFTRHTSDYKIDEKYIEDFVANQLDKTFLDNSIPVHVRLAYWLMRSIPSRVSEITGMKVDCLKPSYDDNMALFIPTWKQNGENFEPELRTIYLDPKGDFEKFLISMIQEQQEIAKGLQDDISDKDYLFTVRHKTENRSLIFTSQLVGLAFRDICVERGIEDEEGNEYIFTTHQLRHNGITDRIDAGFSFIEIRDMTNHKGNSMIWNAYYHPRKEKSLEKQKQLIKQKNNIEVEKPVYFRGRIINIDETLEKRLLSSPRAYKLMEGENNIGICSDITGCNSGMFKCLDCDYFIPNAEDLDYFKKQVSIWEKKVELFKSKKQAYENAKYNLRVHKKIVERIESQLKLIDMGA